MNIQLGIQQYNGNERQFQTTLVTFDSLTLNPAIIKICEAYEISDIKSLLQELKQVYQSSQIVQLTDFSSEIYRFIRFIEATNKLVPNYEYQLHNQLRSFMIKVKETKQLIEQYTSVQVNQQQIDLILQQILLGYMQSQPPSQQRTNRSQIVEQQDEKQQPTTEVVSQPRQQNDDCCIIY